MTTIYGGKAFNDHWQIRLDYDVTDLGSSVRVDATVYWLTLGWRYDISIGVNAGITIDGEFSYQSDNRIYEATSGNHTHKLYSFSKTIEKGSSARTIQVIGVINNHSTYATGRVEASGTVTIGAGAGKTYTVSYDANGGTGAPASQTKAAGVPLRLSSQVPTRAGYEFGGWCEGRAVSPTYYPDTTYADDRDLYLVAYWIPTSSGRAEVKTCSAYRVGSSSSTAESATGAYVYSTFRWEIEMDTASSVRIQYKRFDASSWSSATTKGTTTGASGTTYAWFSAGTAYSWNVRIAITTSAGTQYVALAVGAASSGSVLDIQSRGGAVGVLASAPTSGVALGGQRCYMQSTYVNFAGSDYTPQQIKDVLDGGGAGGSSAWPVGSVYMSFSSTSPASLFGGSWSRINGYFPYFGAGTGTGGSNTVTLSSSNLPAHTHRYDKLWTNNGGSSQLSLGSAGFSLRFDQNINTGSTGSGNSFSNMPLYQSLYAWRRVS